MKLQKVAPGIYRFGNFEITKVARDCWRITTKGYGNDFIKLSDAVYFCRNGGSLYPKLEDSK
jgi:hypothetical protein